MSNVRLHMTTAARVFGILLVIAGLTYGAMAIYMLSHVNEVATTLEMAKAPEHKEFGFASVQDWKEGVRFNAWLYLALGLGATVCGIGITALREWARLFWLGISALLVGFVLFVAIRHSEVWIRYVELLAFAIPSFILLRGRWIKGDNAI
jgi:hypothetical protein